jgi:drug/metabolite transporter (DMT)-like permease
MAVLLALLGALVYGFSDFAGGLATRRATALAVVFSGQAAGVALLAVLLVVVPGRFDPGSIAWGAAAGLSGALALLVFYRALAAGSMTVVAPLTAVTAAVVPVVGGILLGERPSLLALAGVLLAVSAILLVGAERGRLPTAAMLRGRGVGGALLAGAGFGLLFVLLSRAAPDSGFWRLAGARVASLGLLSLVALVSRRSLVPRGAAPLLVIAGGIGDMVANLLFVLASRIGLLSIVGALLALYPAGTVLLALGVLRERLHLVQVVGLVVAGVGVVLIALG